MVHKAAARSGILLEEVEVRSRRAPTVGEVAVIPSNQDRTAGLSKSARSVVLRVASVARSRQALMVVLQVGSAVELHQARSVVQYKEAARLAAEPRGSGERRVALQGVAAHSQSVEAPAVLGSVEVEQQ